MYTYHTKIFFLMVQTDLPKMFAPLRNSPKWTTFTYAMKPATPSAAPVTTVSMICTSALTYRLSQERKYYKRLECVLVKDINVILFHLWTTCCM